MAAADSKGVAQENGEIGFGGSYVLLCLGRQSALPFGYLTPDIRGSLNIETSFLLLKVCRTKVIIQKTILKHLTRSEDAQTKSFPKTHPGGKLAPTPQGAGLFPGGAGEPL